MLLYNHGSAAGMASNLAFANITPGAVGRGWAFFMPYRRGQGLSAAAGPYILDQVASARKKRGLAAAADEQLRVLQTDHLNDQLAGLAWLRQANFVKSDRIAVAGNSFGGIQAVLGAQNGGFCAAIAASAGAQGWSVSPKLRERMTAAVRSARAPMFFFQAENDFDLSPTRASSSRRRGRLESPPR